MDRLRPFLSRIIAAALAALVMFVTRKLGMEYTVDTDGWVLGVADFISLSTYAVFHRLIDGKAKVNPGDAASATWAKVEKAERAELNVDPPLSDQ